MANSTSYHRKHNSCGINSVTSEDTLPVVVLFAKTPLFFYTMFIAII